MAGELVGERRSLQPQVSDLGLSGQRRRGSAWLIGLSGLLVVSVLLGVGVGAVAIGPASVARIIGHHLFGLPGTPTWSLPQDAIVWQVRLPRVLLGVCVGAGLAVCGMALQAMVRNMLADPYLLGINSGASSGAAAAILFGVGVGFGENALPFTAFLGALAASFLVFLIARSGGRVTSVRLLLAGVAVGYALYALTSFLIFASDSAEGSRSVMFWLLGSLGLARWGVSLGIVVAVVLLTVGLLTLWGRRLDALAIGDETAHTLGISPDRFRTRLLVLVSLCIGVLVAASGSIGFVGLVIPHVARRLVGAPHARAVPVAALLGAIFLVWADALSRTLLQPQELPIGIITSLVGAPFLLVLIRRLHATSA
ncbi:iron ABC transporter permease [Kineosporia rhizophila]|uniref:FecCD family ABC transporter permease n=1 Tax=Kineosporia TaxID=49184 RepID=UPI001E4DB14F|nr:MULTISPECIES: iron chelate uptake ABC transporter family permease subunit [Kineosporia]MCE0538228.1 iron ABC transporter permease [Kineosporia rhizophila]GLY15066.1 ABC transporter permease [Kineosporia sp. NBRC 101677]